MHSTSSQEHRPGKPGANRNGFGRKRRLGTLPLGGLLVVAWLALWFAAMLGEYTDHASLWYPPAAVTFAGLVVLGWRAVPFLAAASVASTFVQIRIYGMDLGPFAALGAGLAFTTAHLASYGLAAVLLQRLARKAGGRLPPVILDSLLVAVLGSLLASLLGVNVLAVTGLLPGDQVVETWMPFWVGDLVALIALGPLIGAVLMRLARHPVFRIEPLDGSLLGRKTRPYLVKLAFNVLFISVAMILTAGLRSEEAAFIIFFLVIPQMWLTYSESPMRTAESAALNSVVIVVWTYLLDLDAYAFVYQFAMGMVAATAYIGIAMPLLVSDNARLRQRVMRDSLTGAASREVLEREVAMEIERCERSGRTLCVLVIDVDQFKDVNDRFGHATGDRLLARVFEVARDALRRSDVLARFGGDEFVALLSDTDVDTARQVAERLRALIAEIRSGDGLTVTVSIGLSEFASGDDFAALFERADRALYEAKRAGRNAVRAEQGWAL